jgi:hypothetical protein
VCVLSIFDMGSCELLAWVSFEPPDLCLLNS